MKRILVLLVLLLVVYQASALDLTEEYSHGLSDMELYSASSETQKSLTTMIGYGHSRWINLSLAMTKVQSEQTQNIESTVSVGNFSQIYSGRVNVGLIAGVDFGKKEEEFFAMEWTLPYFRWTPYFKHVSHFTEDGPDTEGSVGLSWKVAPKNELFGEAQWDLVKNKSQSMALGWNFNYGPKIELISEVGYAFNDEGIYGGFGLIWTRE